MKILGHAVCYRVFLLSYDGYGKICPLSKKKEISDESL